MVIDSTTVRLLRAAAITICPFILIDPNLRGAARLTVLRHEWVHWWQQFVFGAVGAFAGVVIWTALSWPLQPETVVVVSLGLVEGWVAGQLLWRWLYLVGFPFGLPIRWNWFRRRWESAAYRAQGLGDEEIKRILRKAPYYLS